MRPLIPLLEIKNIMEDSIHFASLIKKLIKILYHTAAFQRKFLQIIYTNISIIAMLLPRNVSKLHWQRKLFSVSSWSNKEPFCYVCWMATTCVPTNIVDILNVIMWTAWSQLSRHESLERWCLVVHVAYKRNSRRLCAYMVMNSPRPTCLKEG